MVGFPRRKITEVYGLHGVGKTSLLLTSIAGMTADGQKVLLIDVENALDPERAEQLGVDLSKMDVATTTSMEEIDQIILDNLDKYDAIMVDSVAAMIPLAEVEGQSGDAHVGLKARRMGQLMRRVTAPLAKSDCALVFINQLRENLDMFQSKYSTTGGVALKYHAALRLELKTTSKDRVYRKENGENVRGGHYVTAEITKSKVGRPHQSARFKLTY